MSYKIPAAAQKVITETDRSNKRMAADFTSRGLPASTET